MSEEKPLLHQFVDWLHGLFFRGTADEDSSEESEGEPTITPEEPTIEEKEEPVIPPTTDTRKTPIDTYPGDPRKKTELQ